MNILNRLFGKGEQVGFYDETAALPVADVEFIGRGDTVLHERLNERGDVVLAAVGVVTVVNYRTQQVKLTISATVRIWVDVNTVSLITAANTRIRRLVCEAGRGEFGDRPRPIDKDTPV